MLNSCDIFETKSGLPVRDLVRFNTTSLYKWAGIVDFKNGVEQLRTWADDGAYAKGSLCSLDLVKVSRYRDWALDTPVLVLDAANNWIPGHFAGVNERGLPTIWANGATSHTAHSVATCKMPYTVMRKPD